MGKRTQISKSAHKQSKTARKSQKPHINSQKPHIFPATPPPQLNSKGGFHLKHKKIHSIHPKKVVTPGFIAYRGFIPEPKIENFFTGRIWSCHNTPFPQAKINTYIAHKYFAKIPAVTTTPKLICNRCLNTTPQKFIAFHCAKCQQICHYCRHCITMGRMCSCEDLITWTGPSYSVKQASPHFT